MQCQLSRITWKTIVMWSQTSFPQLLQKTPAGPPCVWCPVHTSFVWPPGILISCFLCAQLCASFLGLATSIYSSEFSLNNLYPRKSSMILQNEFSPASVLSLHAMCSSIVTSLLNCICWFLFLFFTALWTAQAFTLSKWVLQKCLLNEWARKWMIVSYGGNILGFGVSG